jgi:hypothetical protein
MGGNRRVAIPFDRSAHGLMAVRQTMHPLPTPEIGRAILEHRFAGSDSTGAFAPPYPSWPLAPSAFDDAPTMLCPSTDTAHITTAPTHQSWRRSGGPHTLQVVIT